MEKLPAEILHHIFDNLDAETIFFSLRPVSRLFRSIAQTYNRYNFDFQSISRPNFGVLLHFIPTQHIQSLTLYNTKTIFDQYETFFSLIRLRQLTCLQSIKLVGISEMQFNYLCKRLNLNSLKSFTLDIEHCDDRRRKTTNSNLSKIFSQPTIRHIDLGISRCQNIDIKCPLECSVEILTIHSNFTFEMLSKVFSCSQQLHKLIIKDDFTGFLTPTQDHETPFRQLKTLIIDYVDIKIINFTHQNVYLRFRKILTPVTNITSLSINFDGKVSTEAIQPFGNSVILSNLIDIELSNTFSSYNDNQALCLMLTYLSNCHQLSKLTINPRYFVTQMYPYLDHICSLLPSQIKSLEIPISDVEQIKIIVEHCTKLQIVCLLNCEKNIFREVKGWFEQNTVGSVFRRDYARIKIWLGKKIDQINKNYKRLKITDKK